MCAPPTDSFVAALETICSDVVFVLSAASMLWCRNAAVNLRRFARVASEEELELLFAHVEEFVWCDTHEHVGGSLHSCFILDRMLLTGGTAFGTIINGYTSLRLPLIIVASSFT